MSKFSQALNKIQQSQSDRGRHRREGGDSIFINSVDEKIRSRQQQDRQATLLSILQPLAILLVIVALVVIFFVGVNQGMKIKEVMQQEETSALEVNKENRDVNPVPAQEVKDEPETGTVKTEPAETENLSSVTPVSETSSLDQKKEIETPKTPEKPQQEKPQTAPSSEMSAFSALSNPNGAFTIQLVAYSSLDRAYRELETLESKGFAPIIIPGGALFQVCLNRFESVEKAKAFMQYNEVQSILGKYPGAYIRNVPTRRDQG